MESGPRLSIRGLSVSFGSNRALDGLDLDVDPCTIVALLGANGSGKSTAVKALSGINQTEPGGSMQLSGRAVELGSLDPVVARQSGIRVVHQEAPLVPDLTVAEAVALSVGFPTASGFIRQREMNRRAEALLAEFSIDVDVTRLCRSLSPAERSLVSFAIAIGDIGVDHAVLILDEATASLSTGDAERFLVKVRESADRGLAVLMVTHRLPEVREHCDSTVVLRDGKVVDSFDRDTFDEMAVVRAMVGPEGPAEAAGSAETGSATGIGNRVVATALRGGGLSDLTFTANHGEILGVTGRTGGGASELLRLIGGIDQAEGGALRLGDATLAIRSPRDAIASGIFYLSADRLVEGGVPALSVAENLVLPKVERYGWSRSKPAADVASMMALLDIRPPDSSVAFGGLSGGNQQKVLLARWLLLSPRVLLLDDPTAGVDPNTREVIFSNLKSLAKAGTTIIFRSTEPEQLARLCQRVLVMREGHIVTELSHDQLTIEEISLATYA